MPKQFESGKYYAPFDIVPEELKKYFQPYVIENFIAINDIIEQAKSHKNNFSDTFNTTNFEKVFKADTSTACCGFSNSQSNEYKILNNLPGYYTSGTQYVHIPIAGTLPRTSGAYAIDSDFSKQDFIFPTTGEQNASKSLLINGSFGTYRSYPSYNGTAAKMNCYSVYETVLISFTKEKTTGEYAIVTCHDYWKSYDDYSPSWQVFTKEDFNNIGYNALSSTFTLLVGAGGGGGVDTTSAAGAGGGGGAGATIALKVRLVPDETIVIFLGRRGLARYYESGTEINTACFGGPTYITTTLDVAEYNPSLIRLFDYQEGQKIYPIKLLSIDSTRLGWYTISNLDYKDIDFTNKLKTKVVKNIELGCGQWGDETGTGGAGGKGQVSDGCHLITDYAISKKYLIIDGNAGKVPESSYTTQTVPGITADLGQFEFQTTDTVKGVSEFDYGHDCYGGAGGLIASRSYGGNGGNTSIQSSSITPGGVSWVALLY